MGSYLMACAVTGASITEGAEVVAFEMDTELGEGRGNGYQMNQTWFIKGYPIHGTYNDYGTVYVKDDNTEYDSSELNLMIMYKWAWEILMDLVKKSDEENDASYVEYNKQGYDYENYRLKYIENAKKEIDAHIKWKDLKLPSIETMASQPEEIQKLMIENITSYRYSNYLRWGGEGCSKSDGYWRDTILDSEDPHATYEKFMAEVLPMMQSKYFIFYHQDPSLYGSQESNAKEMVALYTKGLEYFKNQLELWEDHD